MEDYLATLDMCRFQELIDRMFSDLGNSRAEATCPRQEMEEWGNELEHAQSVAVEVERTLREQLEPRDVELEQLRTSAAVRDAKLRDPQSQLEAALLRASDAERVASSPGNAALLAQVLTQSLKDAREEAKAAKDSAKATREELRNVEWERDMLWAQVQGFEMVRSSRSHSTTARHHS